MNKSVYIILILLLSFPATYGQLTSNKKSVVVGKIDCRATSQIVVPVLNQSREKLYLSFYVPGAQSGLTSLPDRLESYESDYISKSFTSQSNQNKIRDKIVFKTSEGRIAIKIKGKIDNSSSAMECYNFDGKKVKVKTSGKYISGKMESQLIRIYDQKDKNTLYASDPSKVPFAHMVILVDASGSMGGQEKLDQIKNHLYSFVDEMRPTDYISILRYSEGTELVLDKVSCAEKEIIKNAIEDIKAGGFTNGKDGIETALEHSRNTQSAGYSNHVVMLTDGAFNFGVEQEGIRRYLLGQSNTMNYKLSIMAIGSDKENAKEMKELTNSGNGYYFNLDGKTEDRNSRNKILIKQLSS